MPYITVGKENADGLAELGVAAAAAAIRNGDISSESYTSALLRRAQMGDVIVDKPTR